MSTAKIIDKLKKLRNLAENNTNPDEAATAAALVQDLLFKHNLSESDISGDLDFTPAYEKEYFDLKVSSLTMKKWRLSLIHVIAENNFCKLINTNGSLTMLIGQEDNRYVVKYLYDLISNDLIRMQKIAFKGKMVAQKKAIKEGLTMYLSDFIGDPAIWKKSFYLGAVNTIANRLAQQKRINIHNADEDNGKGTALALKIDNALREAVEDLVGATRKQKYRTTKLDYDGYSSGVKAGNDTKLNREMPTRRVALNG